MFTSHVDEAVQTLADLARPWLMWRLWTRHGILGLWHSQLVALSVACQGVAASCGAGARAPAGDLQSRARLAAGDVGNYTAASQIEFSFAR